MFCIGAPSIKDFKRMDFLRTKNLTFDSYENVESLTGRGRNDVSLATLDGRPVVLKAYDLGASGATSIAAVTKEVRELHRMRHPNIVQVEAVFEKLAQGEAKMYLQMPRYHSDLRDWLQRHEAKMPAEQRRKILLGLLRAVARVHEFKFTHNDIKLENILLTEQHEAVLCDFELLKEESMAGATSGVTTLVGGTPAYMPPERWGHGGVTGKPHWTADMFAVGVVMLLCFVPSRIVDVTRSKDYTPATTVRQEVEGQLDERINGFIAALLSNSRDKRPAARAMLPEGQIERAEADNYFSRASSDVPTYWLPGDAMLNSVTDDAHIMAALRRAIAPRRPGEFGKGFDAGKEWADVVCICFGPSSCLTKTSRVTLILLGTLINNAASCAPGRGWTMRKTARSRSKGPGACRTSRSGRLTRRRSSGWQTTCRRARPLTAMNRGGPRARS
jgi:serine/threonine protein kinase